MTAEGDLDVIVEEPFRRTPPFRPEPDPASVRAALAELQQASRPVIVAGGGVRASGARDELRALAEALDIPVITSLNAKETFPRRPSTRGRRLRHLFPRMRQSSLRRSRSRLLRRQPQGRTGHQHLETPPSRRPHCPT